MTGYLFILLAIFFNVSAQVFIKLGGGRTTSNFDLLSKSTFFVLIALLFYALSFMLTIKVYADNPISVVVPFMAGLTILLISTLGIVFFGETFKIDKVFGSILIVSGIFFLSKA